MSSLDVQVPSQHFHLVALFVKATKMSGSLKEFSLPWRTHTAASIRYPSVWRQGLLQGYVLQLFEFLFSYPYNPVAIIDVDQRKLKLQQREIDSRPGGPNCVGRLEEKGGGTMSLLCDHRPAVRLNARFVKGGKCRGRKREVQE